MDPAIRSMSPSKLDRAASVGTRSRQDGYCHRRQQTVRRRRNAGRQTARRCCLPNLASCRRRCRPFLPPVDQMLRRQRRRSVAVARRGKYLLRTKFSIIIIIKRVLLKC